MMETIFISIAAQDDEELKYTIDYAFENADNPERVYVGVGLTAMKKQTLKELKERSETNSRIKYNFVKQKRNSIETLGIGKGRTNAAKLYDNQDYMLQIDCHSFLDKSWDTNLIDLFKEASKEVGEGNFVLSAIPPVYRYCCKDHPEPIKSEPNNRYPFYETHLFFVYVVPRWAESDLSRFELPKFLPVTKVSPAFVFGNKSFAENPGIHKDAIFYDEDYTQSANLFSRDFAFVFPNVEDLPVRHLDSNGIVEGHERYFFLKYLNAKHNELIHEKLQREYLSFVKDPNNRSIVEKYKKYSKVDPIKGYFSANRDPIPKGFRMQ